VDGLTGFREAIKAAYFKVVYNVASSFRSGQAPDMCHTKTAKVCGGYEDGITSLTKEAA
jgi:hypothetical protein